MADPHLSDPRLPDLEISDLRAVPDFAETVADRIWQAWWVGDGAPLSALRTRLDESLGPTPVPTTFVAHDASGFLGTVGLIACDMEERQELTPWVAALWVEPEHRHRGIGRALVARAVQAGFAAGHERLYLCAQPQNGAYYVGLGWRRIETDIGGLDIFMLERSAPQD